MSNDHLDRLPTLADRPKFCPQPKYATPSRLQVKAARDKDDKQKLAVWRREVFDRDEGRCRCCHCKVVRLRVQVLHPRRAECHHVAGRDERAVRYDTRAGLQLCATCHQKVTGAVNEKLTIVGTVFFQKGGTKYINADHLIRFIEVA